MNDRIKGTGSDVTCQPLSQSKCDKVCDTDSYNKQTWESNNFYTKSPYLSHDRIFLYKVFPMEKGPNFRFLDGPKS